MIGHRREFNIGGELFNLNAKVYFFLGGAEAKSNIGGNMSLLVPIPWSVIYKTFHNKILSIRNKIDMFTLTNFEILHLERNIRSYLICRVLCE